MGKERIELELRCVRLGEPAPGAHRPVAILGPRSEPDAGVLALQVGAGDARALLGERRGEPTVRSQALGLASRVAAALGGRLAAAHLIGTGPGRVTGQIVIDTLDGPVGVPAEPGQAVAAAVCLRLPLLADRALLRADEAGRSLDGPLAAFLETLDLSGLAPPRSQTGSDNSTG